MQQDGGHKIEDDDVKRNHVENQHNLENISILPHGNNKLPVIGNLLHVPKESGLPHKVVL